MKKIFTLLLGGALCCPLFAGVDPSTAWWNNESFESFDVGTDLKTGWTNNGGSPFVGIQTVSENKVLAITLNGGNLFGEVSQSGNRGVYRIFDNELSGLVYVKTSFYHCTSGTTYALKNSLGEIVFEFGGVNNNAGKSLFFTGKTVDEVALANRAQWSDLEMVLDLKSKKIVKISLTNGSTTKSFTDVNLVNGGDIKRLDVTMFRSYVAAGLDNATFGELIADKLKNLSGVESLQTISGEDVTSDYSLTAYTEIMGLDMAVEQTDLNINWSIDDYGALNETDKLLVGLTANVTDSRKAKLTVGAISEDATVTLKAELGGVSVTKTVELKKSDLDGLKVSLLNEINATNALVDGVLDSNPYILGLKSTLNTAKGVAQGVYDNPSADISTIAQAISNMQDAESDFTTAMNPYNEFVNYITTVQSSHDTEVRTANFFATLKSTLSTAIATATASRATISSETDIVNSKGALESALNQFVADVPVYEGLETAIAAVETKLLAVNLRKGDTQFLMYHTVNVTALEDAKNTASSLLTTATTVLQITEGQSDLSSALTVFNQQGRVAPDHTKLYKIYTYGVPSGDGNAEKKLLYVDGTTVKYSTDIDNVENSEWLITEVSTGKYTLKNNKLGVYLTGTEVGETAVEFSFVENKSQSGTIVVDEPYFLYAIARPDNRVMEINEASNGNTFRFSSTIFERFRVCYQFEPVPLVETGIENVEATKIIESYESYDLTGKAVSKDFKGFVIKRIKYTDGSVSNVKTFNK